MTGSKFVGDLSPDQAAKLELRRHLDSYDLFNYLFINFNFTSLLDDYIYLDQRQFHPLYRGVDTNFKFMVDPTKPNNWHGTQPENLYGTTFSGYVTSNVIHPHGQQRIPRSLLFGIDMPNRIENYQDPKLALAKPFWAQNNVKYVHLFEDTELYIIFGCSLGASDRWWWRHIIDSLGVARTREGRSSGDQRDTYVPELILYWFNEDGKTVSDEEIRDKFLQYANNPTERQRCEPHIHVVSYNSCSSRYWLKTRDKPENEIDA